MKIESTAELDLDRAEDMTKSITALLEGIRRTPPEDLVANNARLRDIALRMDELAEALKITPPMTDLQARLTRHRETERRHRDQRSQICQLVQTPWESAPARVHELLQDQRRAIDLFGEVRAAAASAGLDPIMAPVDMVKQLAEERRGLYVVLADAGSANASIIETARRLVEERGQASAPPPDYSDRLLAIHDELKAAGLIDDQADPMLPIAGVRILIAERRELLEEMAKSVSQEQIVDALAGPPPFDAPEPDEPEHPRAVADFMSGDVHEPIDAEPDLLPAALRAAHDALVAVITASERDWSRSADLAWIYGVLVGWSEDDLMVLQVNFGWREQVVRVIDEHRAALVCAEMSEP